MTMLTGSNKSILLRLFKNDILARTNAYKQKNCRMKKKYSNIFEDSNTWEINCDGDYLDSYHIQD